MNFLFNCGFGDHVKQEHYLTTTSSRKHVRVIYTSYTPLLFQINYSQCFQNSHKNSSIQALINFGGESGYDFRTLEMIYERRHPLGICTVNNLHHSGS